MGVSANFNTNSKLERRQIMASLKMVAQYLRTIGFDGDAAEYQISGATLTGTIQNVMCTEH